MNSSIVTPDQSRPWKNSVFNLPKKPSHLALSGAAPLPRHRPGQAVLLADPYPSRPAIVPTSIRVHRGAVPFVEPPARVGQG